MGQLILHSPAFGCAHSSSRRARAAEPVELGLLLAPRNLGNQVNFRHLETANFLFCDGHVKALHGITGSLYPKLQGYSTLADGSADVSYGAALPQ